MREVLISVGGTIRVLVYACSETTISGLKCIMKSQSSFT